LLKIIRTTVHGTKNTYKNLHAVNSEDGKGQEMRVEVGNFNVFIIKFNLQINVGYTGN